MGFLKKYRIEIICGVAILLIFFVIRLYNLLSLSIFTDEAIYIRWAQIAKNDANWRFISLTDGKQPMFVWLSMIFMRFIRDPLLAGRIVSVFSGLASLTGLFFLGRELFKNRWVGIFSSLLYVIYPFALVYDKMALYDSLVGTFMIWGFYFETLLVRRNRLDIAFISSLVIGGGMLTKTNAFSNLYLLPLTVILFNFKSKERVLNFIKWIGLCILIVVLSNIYYSVLRLSPFFHFITEKNALFVYPFKEWLQHPFTFFLGNLLVGQRDWLIRYMTVPVLALIAIAFFIDKKFFKEKLILFLWFLIPFLYLALFGKTIYPRFIFYMTLFLLPLAAFTFIKLFSFINNKFAYLLFCLLALFLMLRSDYFILFDFIHAPIPISDLNQYSNDWPSGKGVNEAVGFFKKVSKNKKIFVATQGTFGLLPAAFEMYFLDNKNIELKGYWPIEESIPSEVLKKSKQMPTYFVFHEPCTLCPEKGLAPLSWGLKPVLRINKQVEYSYFTVYEVLPT